MPQRAATTSSLLEKKAPAAVPKHDPPYSKTEAKPKEITQSGAMTDSAAKPKPQNPAFSKQSSKASLDSFVASAAVKGYSSSKLARLCAKIDYISKKYDLDYEELVTKLSEKGKELESKNRELESLQKQMEVTRKNHSELMKKYGVEERQVQDYAEAREALNQFGVDIDELQNVKPFLIGLKKNNFDPSIIIEKLKTIGDLDSKRGTLQNEINVLSGELRTKKALLMQLRKMQETGLGVAQMERIRDIVSKISSSHGISPDESFSRFEQDVLKYYNVALGLETEVAMLTENKDALTKEWDLKLKGLEEREKTILENNRKLEEKYESQGELIKGYGNLLSHGIDGTKILAWEKILEESKIPPEILDGEIRKNGNLAAFERETKNRIEELEEKQGELKAVVVELENKKKSVEASFSTFQESSLAQIKETSSRVIASILESKKEADNVTEQSRADLEKMLGDLSSSASTASNGMRDVLKDIEPQLKNLSQAIEASRLIGKYESILPILKLADSSQPFNRINETEAMIAMWNISNIFNAWLGNHLTNGRKEIREPLKDVIEAIDSEIQRVGSQPA